MKPSNLRLNFVTGAMIALVLAALPAFAQISGGILNAPPAGDLSQRISTAQAEFASVLAKALSPENVAALVRRVKEAPSVPDGISGTNFDNVNAPCDFIGTLPLRGHDEGAGFIAPPPNGAAILNGCGNFGVDPRSPPNFLAFNALAAYNTEGVATLPELILVPPNKSSVSLWASGGSKPGFPFAVVAVNSGGVIGVLTTITSSDWVQLTLAASNIAAIYLVGNPIQLVIDDITAQ